MGPFDRITHPRCDGADRLALADRLRHDAPPLAWVGTSRRLRWLLRDFLDHAWTAGDLLHALDTHPDTGPYAYATSAPGNPGGLRNPAGWVLHRLKPWRAPATGPPSHRSALSTPRRWSPGGPPTWSKRPPRAARRRRRPGRPRATRPPGPRSPAPGTPLGRDAGDRRRGSYDQTPPGGRPPPTCSPPDRKSPTMSRPPLPERSLAAVNPEVAAQLHPTRNGATTAEAVSAGSPVRLWWACPAGHDWQAPVTSRTRGAGCPYCAGVLPTPATCLAARDPAVAAQWHPTRTGALTPADVLPSSNRRVWWQCPGLHAWPAQINARTRGTGCPDCSRPQPAPTLLAGHPDLAAQWDTTANGELTPAVTAGSKRRVRWRCHNGHQWLARIDSRSSGAGCPYCAGRVTTPETAFGVRYPHLRDEWAGDLNGNLDPATLGPGVSRRVWWRCRTDPDHMWQAAVADRGSRATGCPYCTGRRVTAQTSLAAVHPGVAAEWDPDRNGDRTPATVHPSSNKHRVVAVPRRARLAGPGRQPHRRRLRLPLLCRPARHPRPPPSPAPTLTSPRSGIPPATVTCGPPESARAAASPCGGSARPGTPGRPGSTYAPAGRPAAPPVPHPATGGCW